MIVQFSFTTFSVLLSEDYLKKDYSLYDASCIFPVEKRLYTDELGGLLKTSDERRRSETCLLYFSMNEKH